MSDKLTTLTAADIADFKKLQAQAIEEFGKSAHHYQKCAEVLLVIKRRELWRADKHENWMAFLDFVAEKLDKTPRRLFQMIRETETRFRLLKSFQVKSPNLSKIAEKLSPKAISEIAKAPEEKQAELLEISSKQFAGEVPTAPAIAAAARAAKVKIEKGHEPRDLTPNGGAPIKNKALLPMWERRDEVQPMLTQISNMKGTIKKAFDAGDPLYAWIGNAVIADLSKAYVSISNAKLHALCTDCQGWPDTKGKAGCGTCHGVGFISKASYDRDSRSEIKTIRERGNAQAE